MVFRGQPSRDCLPCRRRKLKCDLVETGCGQCRRAEIRCHGYRDLKDMIFRDQTHSIVRKTCARQSKSFKPSSHPSLPARLQLAWDAQARHEFFAHYVFGLSSSYDTLATLYQAAKYGDQVCASVDAVSLAFLSCWMPRDHGARRLASQAYLRALPQVNASLACSERAYEDSTLQCVLLLDLYEKLMSSGHHLLSHAGWMSHVDGAVALVKGRGKRNLSSDVSRRLGKRMYTTVIISCLAVGTKMPPAVSQLRRDLSQFPTVANDMKWSLTVLNEEIVDFQADIEAGRRYLTSDSILIKATELDQRYQDVLKGLPTSWKEVDVRHLDAEDEYRPLTFCGTYIHYNSHTQAQFHNIIRMFRIIMHLIIREQDNSNTDNNHDLGNSIEEAVESICASVPQYIIPSGFPENQIPFGPLQRMRCCTLLAPLYLAGKISRHDSVRRWVVGMLAYMADVGGLAMANQVAENLMQRPGTRFWDVYAMVGGYAFTS